MHKMEFGQAYCQDLVKRILRKFIIYFLSFSLFSMHFRNLHEFLENLKGEGHQCLPRRRLDVEVAESGGAVVFPHRRWSLVAGGGW
jgi:hypothetical protein